MYVNIPDLKMETKLTIIEYLKEQEFKDIT